MFLIQWIQTVPYIYLFFCESKKNDLGESMCLLFAHHPKRLFVGHRMDICRALQRGFGVSITWTCPRGLVSDIWRKKIFVEPSKVLHYTDGLCLICVQRSLLRRRTLHGYLWLPPKFYMTRTCHKGLEKEDICGSLQSSTLHGLVPEAATALMRPTTVRWDLTKQQADLTKQNMPC